MVRERYPELLASLSKAFADLESTVEKPELINRGSGSSFRYRIGSLEAAAIQKLARVISGLGGGLVLMEAGFYQELAVLFRTLDELGEDICFLCEGLRRAEPTDLQKEYLKYFYQEEFDQPDGPLMSNQKRGMIPRKKIQSAIAKIPEFEVNSSDHQELMRTLEKANSGYVHAASSQIMDMYGGNPPKFYLCGMLGTPRTQTFNTLFWEYAYRGILSTMTVADALQQDEILHCLYRLRTSFEEQSGRSQWDDPATLLKRQKARETANKPE